MNKICLTLLYVSYLSSLHADLGTIRFSGLTNDIIDQTTISAPGNYRLARSLAVSSGVAITITTSNVELDLDNFEIVGTGTGTGILINAGFENITVKNGTIDSFNSGISVQDNTTRIRLLNLDVVRCGSLESILFDGPASPTEPSISQVSVQNVNVTQCSINGNALVLLRGCKDPIISNCTINENLLGTGTGLQLLNCRNCLINDLQINDNAAEIVTALGLLNTTSGCVIENCEIKINQATNEFTGILLDADSSQNYFSNCLVAQNTAGLGNNGFLIRSPHNLFQQCEASHNTGGNVNGFLISAVAEDNGTNNVLIGCIVRDNQATAAATIGFNLAATNFCRIIRCLAFDNFAEGTSSIGFNVKTNNNEVKECQALGNDIGFSLTPGASDALFQNISTQNRNVQYDGGFPAGSFQLSANLAGINAALTVPWTNVGIGT